MDGSQKHSSFYVVLGCSWNECLGVVMATSTLHQ